MILVMGTTKKTWDRTHQGATLYRKALQVHRSESLVRGTGTPK
jgi:hypothetical protein